MLVNLRNNWYGPNDTLYEKSKNPHSFPSAWEELLPKSATVLEEPAKPAEEKPVAAKK